MKACLRRGGEEEVWRGKPAKQISGRACGAIKVRIYRGLYQKKRLVKLGNRQQKA